MTISQSVAFIDRLIDQTKQGLITWSPVKNELIESWFPRLSLKESYYCEIKNAVLAVGILAKEFVRFTDVDIFIHIKDSKTYSIHEYTALSDGQDFDLLCSKIFRLHNLLNDSDYSLDEFVSNYLKDNH